MAFTMTITMYIALTLLLGFVFIGTAFGILTQNPFTMTAIYMFFAIVGILLFPEIHGTAEMIEGAFQGS